MKHKIALFGFFWGRLTSSRKNYVNGNSCQILIVYPNNGAARKLSNVIIRRKASFYNAKRIRRNGEILVCLECENANR